MEETLFSLLRTCFALALIVLVGCSDPWCGDLVYDRVNDTCVCPMGSWPNYDLDRCEFPNGDVIPWMEFDVPVSGPMADGGTVDGGPADSGVDAISDMSVSDVGDGGISIDVGDDTPVDAGPTPAAMLARFPWNGYSTGSIHVPETAPIVNHPLRPKFMWEESSGAETYQIQLTRECAVADFRSCVFDSPELDETTTETTFHPAASLGVSRAQPVGSRYYWRVRPCSAGGCADWTETRYLDVGRDIHDFNGDGYADVAIGAARQNNPEESEGNVYVYYGDGPGIPTAPDLTLDNPLDQAGGNFGSAIAAAGDINADGFGDLLVAASGQSVPEDTEGQVYVFLGGSAGLSALPDFAIDHPEDGAFGRFGLSVGSAGDLNADGYADIAVTSLGQYGTFLFFGSPRGVPTVPSLFLSDGRTENVVGYTARGIGDTNGDGFVDLALGATRGDFWDTQLNNCYVFYGSESVAPTPESTLMNPLGDDNGGFGNAVVGGDFDGDGFVDLVVGANRQDAPEDNEGAVYIYRGGRGGLSHEPSVSIDNPEDQSGGVFGTDIGTGDVSGDGLDDLIVGASGQSGPEEKEGSIFVFLGTATGLSETPSVSIDNPHNEANARFGSSLAVIGDVDGDGYENLVVGALAGRFLREGRAYLFSGGPTGTREVPGISLTNPLFQARAEFGTVGD